MPPVAKLHDMAESAAKPASGRVVIPPSGSTCTDMRDS